MLKPRGCGEGALEETAREVEAESAREQPAEVEVAHMRRAQLGELAGALAAVAHGELKRDRRLQEGIADKLEPLEGWERVPHRDLAQQVGLGLDAQAERMLQSEAEGVGAGFEGRVRGPLGSAPLGRGVQQLGGRAEVQGRAARRRVRQDHGFEEGVGRVERRRQRRGQRRRQLAGSGLEPRQGSDAEQSLDNVCLLLDGAGLPAQARQRGAHLERAVQRVRRQPHLPRPLLKVAVPLEELLGRVESAHLGRLRRGRGRKRMRYGEEAEHAVAQPLGRFVVAAAARVAPHQVEGGGLGGGLSRRRTGGGGGGEAWRVDVHRLTALDHWRRRWRRRGLRCLGARTPVRQRRGEQIGRPLRATLHAAAHLAEQRAPALELGD